MSVSVSVHVGVCVRVSVSVHVCVCVCVRVCARTKVIIENASMCSHNNKLFPQDADFSLKIRILTSNIFIGRICKYIIRPILMGFDLTFGSPFTTHTPTDSRGITTRGKAVNG